jgi:peptidoglycan/xylan/chitin deacetylase (PgdA/CDA1 family)
MKTDMLKRSIQSAMGWLIRHSGAYALLLKTVWRGKTTILVYHDPEPQGFKRQIAFLARHHQFVTLSVFVETIRSRDGSRLPPNAMIVTIDDGHKGNYRLLETITAFQLHPTIYLCSHIVNTNRHYWWKSGYADPNSLKQLPSRRALEVLKKEVDFEPEKEYPDRQALNQEETMDMLPHVEFGSHTKLHPILTKCMVEECEDEIRESKSCLESLIGRAVDHFCFPNGDYGSRELQAVKKSGYKSARTLRWGRNDAHADPFQLKVVEVMDHSSINRLCAQLCGFWGAFRTLKAKIFL